MEMLARIVHETGSKLKLIGVGGVATARDVRERLHAGASHVHLATAPMIDPCVGVRIREELAA
jgi:dihydroorotate dehydrogenase